MFRREILAKAGLFALAALSGKAMGEDMPHDHQHMHHNPYSNLIDSSSDCISKGQACMSHCLELLGQGNKDMADCAKSVNQMLALCLSLQSLANQQSTLLPALAKVALNACQSCETACRKHESIHAACKACAESCANCIIQCKAIAA
ncbi:four-helix bundle copper-binding protein [Undibacterium sp. Ji67W]|uniref:four-helix bundle copper-binding protein n=1 Tax=Undibacterium sp. Ji67W TaxID=3413042 RepID=UPI003BF19934